MSRRLYLGEKRYVGMTVSRRDDEAFTIAGASFEVKDAAGAVVESGTASVDDNQVFFLFDTTKTSGTPAAALYAAGRSYKAWFAVTITGLGKLLKEYVLVEIT